MRLSKVDEAIYSTLAYSSIFHYPLTEAEIVRRLISPNIFSKDSVIQGIKNLCKLKLIKTKDKHFCLSEQYGSIKHHAAIEHIAKYKIMYADKILKRLVKIPWIDALLVTGSVSAGNADLDDDIDILLITSTNRLWIVRLLAIGMLEIMRVRRRPHDSNIKDKICLNILLDSSHTSVAIENHNIYVAHEVLQARVIFDKNNNYGNFLYSNRWVKQYLAKWYQVKIKTLRENMHKNEPRTVFLISFIIDLLNHLLFIMQTIYMKKKKTKEQVTYHQAFFHPKPINQQVLQSFELLKKSIY